MFLEQQNDTQADELAEKARHLKRVTIAIGDEVRSHVSNVYPFQHFEIHFRRNLSTKWIPASISREPCLDQL